MTGSDDTQISWDDALAQDPHEALELAAAGACLGAQQLLQQAVAQRPDLSQVEIAGLLRVSQGRVSQVLHGEGVQNLALLARYLRALGYDVRLDARPVDATAPELARRTRSRRPAPAPAPPAATGHLYKQVFASRAGVYEATALVPAPPGAEGLTPLGGPRLAATWRVGTAGRTTFTAVPPVAPVPEAAPVPVTTDRPGQQGVTPR